MKFKRRAIAKFNFSPFGNKYEHKLGITFSGGSARGYAHVGVLKALKEHNIEPGVISGTSMGAVVGILYAAGFEPLEIQQILIRESFSKVTGFSWQKTGLLKMEKLKVVLKKYLPEDDFSGLKKPFFLGLSNLNKAQQEVRNSGPIYDYLIASCSVPGFFAPVIIAEEHYVDGGVICNLPAAAIRERCRYLIGSHVNYSGNKISFSGPKGIMERAVNISINQNAKPQMDLCDFVIDPPKMQNFSLFEFSKIEEIIEVGYTHTQEMIAAGKIPVKKLANR